LPPARRTLSMAAPMSSTAMTTEGCCAGQSGLSAKNPPLIAPGFSGHDGPVSVVVART